MVRLTTESNAYKMQEGSFTRTTGTSTRNSRRSLTMHGLECVGFFALFYFHFTFFILSFIFILRYLHLTLIFNFLVNADQFAETPLDKVGVKPEISYTNVATWNSAKHSGRLVQVSQQRHRRRRCYIGSRDSEATGLTGSRRVTIRR